MMQSTKEHLHSVVRRVVVDTKTSKPSQQKNTNRGCTKPTKHWKESKMFRKELLVLDWFIIGLGIVSFLLGEYAVAASLFSFVAAMNTAFKKCEE